MSLPFLSACPTLTQFMPLADVSPCPPLSQSMSDSIHPSFFQSMTSDPVHTPFYLNTCSTFDSVYVPSLTQSLFHR